MRKPAHPMSPLTLVIAAMALFAAWTFLAPTQLGGRNAYLLTTGISMQPLLSPGELAVVRRSDHYETGDIVAYYMLPHTVVLHRIVSEDNGHFTMKGDNNPNADGVQPTRGDIVGKLWFHMPSLGLGTASQALRTPPVAGLATLLGGLAVAMTISPLSPERFRRRRAAVSGTMGPHLGVGAPVLAQAALIVAGVVLVTLALTIVAFCQPTQRTVSHASTYEQSGSFSYSAPAPDWLYGGETVTSGEPLYLRLVHELDVNFDYRFAAPDKHDVKGTYEVWAELSNSSGWQRRAELVPETPFSGDALSTTTRLDVSQLPPLFQAMGEQTGVTSDRFTLAIAPTVRLDSSLGGEDLHDTFAPRLLFRADAEQLTLDKAAESTDPLRTGKAGWVQVPSKAVNQLSVLGFAAPLPLVRGAALAAFMLSLLALVALLLLLRPALRATGPERIQACYSHLLLDVTEEPAATGAGISSAELLRMEDLVKIAERERRMILHHANGPVHRYFVMDGDAVYSYTARALPRDIAEEAA